MSILAGMVRAWLPSGARVLAVLVLMSIMACVWVWSQSAATAVLASTAVLKVDNTRPGSLFAAGSVGLSTEARELDSGRLSANNVNLVRLMRLLGPAVLRIGGNTVDLSWWTSTGEPPPPWATSTVTPSDLFALRGLLAAAGWRVLLGVDLGHFEPVRAADEARYAQVILGSRLLGIEIGNEPDDFSGAKINLRSPTYGVGEYLREANAYDQAIGTATSGIAVFGPALSLRPPWLGQIGASAHMFTQITQHYYAINTPCPTTVPSKPQPTAVELLAPAVRQQENELLHTLALAGSTADRSVRVGETNSVPCGGNVDASPGFAGALWSLDWILRAQSNGVLGMNFHGSLGPCRPYPESPVCGSGDENTASGSNLTAQPEYYGLLAARQLEGGRFVPTRLIASEPLPNLSTWATVASDGTVRVAIDDLATTGLAQPVSIPISGYAATEETLSGPSVGAGNGVTLGDASVTSRGLWLPKRTMLPRASRARSIRVIVRPASAVILTLHRVRSGARRIG
jgi:hypothetical protein